MKIIFLYLTFIFIFYNANANVLENKKTYFLGDRYFDEDLQYLLSEYSNVLCINGEYTEIIVLMKEYEIKGENKDFAFIFYKSNNITYLDILISDVRISDTLISNIKINKADIFKYNQKSKIWFTPYEIGGTYLPICPNFGEMLSFRYEAVLYYKKKLITYFDYTEDHPSSVDPKRTKLQKQYLSELNSIIKEELDKLGLLK